MLIADTHVHLYAPYQGEAVFSAALNRMLDLRVTSPLITVTASTSYAIFLTEVSNSDEFSCLEQSAPVVTPGVRRFVDVKGGASLYIVQGYQARTAERLEVLALATTHRPADGAPIASTIAAVHDSGGIAVVPWSFGKWSGKRLTLVRNTLKDTPHPFLLGDIPTRWPYRLLPTLTDSVQLPQSTRVIYGSDPLPLPQEYSRIGTAVTVFDDNDDLSQDIVTLATFQKILLDAPITTILGKRLPIYRPLLDIIRLRMSKKFNYSGWIKSGFFCSSTKHEKPPEGAILRSKSGGGHD